MKTETLPLCVDLDGTLIATDTLWESLFVLLRRRPWLCLWLPFWLLRGRQYLKTCVSDHALLAVETLPYRAEVLSFLQQQRKQGRHLVLVTAADYRIAEAVAKHLGLFHEVIGSDQQHNLKGRTKRDRLQLIYGEFAYIGDSMADIPVLEAAKERYLVAPPAALQQHFQDSTSRIFQASKVTWQTWFKLLRPHQWSKNALLFIPLLLSSDALMWSKWGLLLIAVLCFSLMASAGYVINDLLDLAADRVHSTKKNRPFAAGTLPIKYGLPMFGGLVLGSSILALSCLPLSFAGILWLYLVLTVLYSFYLKRYLVLDVIVLAGLFTHRIFAGGVAAGVATTSWLLAFSLFLFISLAFLKRYIELAQLQANALVKNRGYQADDLPMVSNFGTISAYLSVLVFALYIHSDDKSAYYQAPFWLWLLCPLWLYGLTRMWFLAHRQQMPDDPVQFVLSDRVSWGLSALTLVFLMLAKWAG